MPCPVEPAGQSWATSGSALALALGVAATLDGGATEDAAAVADAAASAVAESLLHAAETAMTPNSIHALVVDMTAHLTSLRRNARDVSTTPSRSALAASLGLVALSFATRVPALVRAAGTNSDAAIVGLQARHILHGEWSPLLWGSHYQTSADATWAALLFRVFGPTPLVLMLSALVLYVALTMCVYYTLRRRLAPSAAFVATLPLAFTTACVHSYALYPPRQLALTLAFAAIGAIDAASVVSLAAGGALAVLAVVADPYATLFVPAAFVLGLWVVLESRAELASRARALGALFGGAALGAIALAWLLARPEASEGVATMSTHVVRHNARLLWHECLPWAIGTKVYRPLHAMDYAAWPMPRAYAVFAWVGAGALAVALAVAFVLAVRARDRLAAIAWLTIGLVLGSFLVSLMVMDEFSMRYLAAAILVLPFALAPLCARLGAVRAGALLAPYLAVAGAGGWLAYGSRVDTGVVEARVLRALEERHVEAAVADYWAAYRLDFLWREAIPVAPYHVEQDRYAPYRAKLAAAHRIAYVHDRDRSFEDQAQAEREIAASGRVVDRFAWDGFDVVVVERFSDASPRSSASDPRAP